MCPDSDWWTSVTILKSTRCRTGSQCNWRSTGVMWSHRRVPCYGMHMTSNALLKSMYALIMEVWSLIANVSCTFLVSIPIGSEDTTGNKVEDSWAVAHSWSVARRQHGVHSSRTGTRGHGLHLLEKNCWKAQCHKKLWGTFFKNNWDTFY